MASHPPLLHSPHLQSEPRIRLTSPSFRVRGLRSWLALLLGIGFLAGNGAAAAAQELRGLAGERLGEAELAQGTVVVVVWASWSPRSHDIVASVNSIAQRWSGRVRVLSVNFQEDVKVARDFLAGKSFAVPVFMDTDGIFSKRYRIAALPGLLILKNGEVAYQGRLPEDPDPVISASLGRR
ncbi:MAG: redoxin family protein [Acidobacteriota bacterium]|nr:redoxin family protein [Acidobacteriota bacterium]